MQQAVSAHLPRVLASLACAFATARTRDPWLVGCAGEFACAPVTAEYVLGAVRGGHVGILRTLRMPKALWDLVLCEACSVGRTQVAGLAISRGATCLNEALFHACRSDQLQAATMLLARGATNALDCLRTACLWGQFDVAKFLMEHDAMLRGHTHLLPLILK